MDPWGTPQVRGAEQDEKSPRLSEKVLFPDFNQFITVVNKRSMSTGHAVVTCIMFNSALSTLHTAESSEKSYLC